MPRFTVDENFLHENFLHENFAKDLDTQIEQSILQIIPNFLHAIFCITLDQT